MKAFLVILGLLGSFSAAQAQEYTCEDRGKIAETLKALNKDCGGADVVVGSCTANGYEAATVEGARDLCLRENGYFNRQKCFTNINCEKGTPICKANGQSGSSVELAIAACEQNFRDESQGAELAKCKTDITCASAKVCRSNGFAASTIEDAKKACKAHYGYNFEAAKICDQNVGCF